MKKIRFCKICNNYTLEELHCEVSSISAHLPPYNPNDRFGDIRRKLKGMF